MANDWNCPCFHAPEQHGLKGCNIVTCACQAKWRRDYDHSIHSNPDAQAWAKFFCEIWKDVHPDRPVPDEEWMIGWFANAMMAMHDHLLTTKFKEAIREALAHVADEIQMKAHEFEGRKLGHQVYSDEYGGDEGTTEWLRGQGQGARAAEEIVRTAIKKLTDAPFLSTVE